MSDVAGLAPRLRRESWTNGTGEDAATAGAYKSPRKKVCITSTLLWQADWDIYGSQGPWLRRELVGFEEACYERG